jgi:ELWxxDGT repeat protein
VEDIYPSGSSSPHELTSIAGTLFFAAKDGPTGIELWTSEGTAEGTYLVDDIRSGPQGSKPSGLARLGDLLLFKAEDGTHGEEVWKLEL